MFYLGFRWGEEGWQRPRRKWQGVGRSRRSYEIFLLSRFFSVCVLRGGEEDLERLETLVGREGVGGGDGRGLEDDDGVGLRLGRRGAGGRRRRVRERDLLGVALGARDADGYGGRRGSCSYRCCCCRCRRVGGGGGGPEARAGVHGGERGDGEEGGRAGCRCGHTLTAVPAVGEEGAPGYVGPRLILFGGATALEGNSATPPSSAGSAGIRNALLNLSCSCFHVWFGGMVLAC